MDQVKSLMLAVAIFSSGQAWAAEEGMKSMPKIAPKKTYSVDSKEAGEDLQDSRGFGAQEPMVRMMNLMMVGGSGYEGMDMAEASKNQAVAGHGGQMHMEMTPKDEQSAKVSSSASDAFKFDTEVTPNPPKVGSNTVVISIGDIKSGAPQRGLKLKAQVYMRSMDMGTDEPRVREIAPGKYLVKVTFSMKGPWAVKLILPATQKIFDFEVGGTK